MINKKNLWFITLFSIILVLSYFYVGINEDDVKDLIKTNNNELNTEMVIKEDTELVALRIKNDEELQTQIEDLQSQITNKESTIEQKNDAYNALKNINKNKGLEEKIEKIIKKEFKYESFIKITNNNINIVIDTKKHDYKLANQIIKKIQENFKENMYITVKFN